MLLSKSIIEEGYLLYTLVLSYNYSWQQQYNVGTDAVMQLSMLLVLGVLKFQFVTEFFHVEQLQPVL